MVFGSLLLIRFVPILLIATVARVLSWCLSNALAQPWSCCREVAAGPSSGAPCWAFTRKDVFCDFWIVATFGMGSC